ncbi:MAG: PulJ/GspJ family protein [Armatimonadota bacterium]
MKPMRRSQRGYTLMEIVVTLALAGIVVALVGSLFVFSLGAWRRGQDVREAQVQASTLVDIVARDVRSASQAPSVTIRPRIEIADGEPVLSIASATPADPSAEASWIVYVFRQERGDVIRQVVIPEEGGRVTPREGRVVATGVVKIEAVQVANGVTIVVETKRGRATAQARATAAPRNP